MVYLSMTCRPIDLHDENEGVNNFDTFGQLSTGTQGWNAPPLRRQGQHGRLLQGVRASDWCGSLWRSLHSDPYAHAATMGSRRLDEPFFSYEERRQVVATSSHSFRSRALSGRRSPGRERQRRVSLNFVVVRVLVRVDQAGARRNAVTFALDPTGSFDRSLCRIAQRRTSPPTAACNSGPAQLKTMSRHERLRPCRDRTVPCSAR